MADGPSPLAKNKTLLTQVEAVLQKFPDRAALADEAVKEQTAGKYESVGALRAAVKGASSYIPGLARSAAQGALFDFADELAGVGAAIIPGGNDYKGGRDEFRAADDAFREENPKSALAANLAGGLAPLIATMGASAPVTGARIGASAAELVGAKSLGKALLKTATKKALAETAAVEAPGAVGTFSRVVAGGAGAGALQGAGMAKTTDDIIPQAGIGALLGGALGGAGNIAGRAAPKIGRFLKGRLNPAVVEDAGDRRLVEIARDAGGVKKLQTQYGKNQKLRPGMTTLADQNDVTGRVGPLGQAADEALVSAPSLSRTALPALEKRGDTESIRATRDLIQATGVKRNSVNAIAKMEEQLKDRAQKYSGDGGLFEVLGQQHANVPYPKSGNMGRNVADGWQQYAQVPEMGGYQMSWMNRQPSLMELQGYEQELAQKLMNPKLIGARRTALQDIKRKFSEDVEKSVPAYGKAKTGWRDATKRIEALENGRAAITTPGVEAYHVTQAMTKLPPKEREMFKLGMIHEYLRKTNQVRLNASTAKKLFTDKGSEDAMKLAAIFKTPDDFGAFMKKMALEEDFHTTRGLGRNSSTQRRVNAGNAVQDDLAEAQAGAIGAVTGGPLAGITAAVSRMLGKSGTSKGHRAVSEYVGGKLLSLNHAANLATLRRIGSKEGRMALEDMTRREGVGLGGSVGRLPVGLLDLDEEDKPYAF